MTFQDLLVALLRGAHEALLLSLFGTLAFTIVVVPAVGRVSVVGPVLVPLRRLLKVSAGGSVAFGWAWFLTQVSAIAGTTGWLELVTATPTVVAYSRYGQAMAVRLALIIAAILFSSVPRVGSALAVVSCGLALGLQGWIGHAGATGGSTGIGLILSEALHLIAAGAWLGALVPLLLCLWLLPTPGARIACEQFSPIGLAAVLVIAATAFAQALAFVGGVPQLVGTPYGLAALCKLGLFLAMLALAVWNRLSLTDRLDSGNAASARRHMVVSVMTETGMGLLVVLTAGVLASLPQAVFEAPNWPFPWSPSLVVLQDDDLRREVVVALLAVGGGAAAIALSWVARRGRVLALLLALPLIAWRAPSLRLLLVPAYPTSFLTSTTGFSVGAIANGQHLFAANCVSCHGHGGAGNGPLAVALALKPADLTADHLWDHGDGELFWWLTHGIDDWEGGLSMPGFSEVLDEGDRWALIDFIRALNSGASMRERHDWAHPIPAPDMPIQCADGQQDQLSELRGRVVRVIASEGASPAGVSDVVTLRLDQTSARPPPAKGCASATTDAWDAYAVVCGVPPNQLGGTEFLIDAQGWLRAQHRPNEQPTWDNPETLSAAVRAIREQPITNVLGKSLSGGIHVHGH